MTPQEQGQPHDLGDLTCEMHPDELMMQTWDKILAERPPGTENSNCIQAVYWEWSLIQANSIQASFGFDTKQTGSQHKQCLVPVVMQHRQIPLPQNIPWHW